MVNCNPSLKKFHVEQTTLIFKPPAGFSTLKSITHYLLEPPIYHLQSARHLFRTGKHRVLPSLYSFHERRSIQTLAQN